MKTLHILFIFASLTFGFLETANAQTQTEGKDIGWSISNPGGGPILMDHDPGATVHFEVSNNEGIQTGLVLMKIVGTTHDLLGNKIFYQEAEDLVDSKADFSYTIPQNPTNMPYRLVAQFYLLGQNTMCCTDDFLITSNKDKMVLSDLNITKISEDKMNFRFMITTGMNEPIIPISVAVSIPYTENGTSKTSTNMILHKDPHLSAIIQGNVTIPNGLQNGQHYIIINASELTSIQYQSINAKITFDLSDNNTSITDAEINGKKIPINIQTAQPKPIEEKMTPVMEPLSTEPRNGICTGGPGMCQTSLTPVVNIVIDIVVVAAVIVGGFMIFKRLKE